MSPLTRFGSAEVNGQDNWGGELMVYDTSSPHSKFDPKTFHHASMLNFSKMKRPEYCECFVSCSAALHSVELSSWKPYDYLDLTSCIYCKTHANQKITRNGHFVFQFKFSVCFPSHLTSWTNRLLDCCTLTGLTFEGSLFAASVARLFLVGFTTNRRQQGHMSGVSGRFRAEG